jgi:surface antigen
MRIIKIFILIATGLFLNNCVNKSHTGAVLGGATATTMCLEYLGDNPTLIAACAVGGALAGAEALYNSDHDKHNAVFVDHLNNSPNGSSYTNWYNPRTRNGGIIHVTRSYMVGPLKCKEYDHTVDITNSWPMLGLGGVNREVKFGVACQLPDGQWIEKPTGLKPNYVVEGNKRMTVVERNKYIEKYYPEN